MTRDRRKQIEAGREMKKRHEETFGGDAYVH